MITGTHSLMSSILYKYLIKKTGFKLDLMAFAYGNIMPDFDKGYIKCPHTLEDSIHTINAYSENLMKSSVSIQEFSMCLGVVCHFVCDYFCLYHSKEYWKKDPVGHAAYEAALHIKFLTLFSNKNFKLKFKCVPEQSVEDMVNKIFKKYNSEPRTMTNDITYALIASASVGELIIYSSRTYQQNKIV